MSTATAPEKRGGALRRGAAGAGLVIVFSLAAAGGAILHVRLAPGRRLVAAAVTAALEHTFMGRVVVEKIGSIDANGFDGAEASVYDPAGVRVLAVTGLRGRASLARVALSVLRGGDIAIVVPRARVEHADVNLLSDADGIPTLARAFQPRPSSGARSSAPPKISVWMPEVEMRAACVRGKIEGLGDLDVDLANVRGSVLAGTERTSVRVERYSVSLVSPLRTQGTADTRIEIPSASGQSLSIWAAFDGFVGDVQVDARGELDGRDVRITGDVVSARPEAVRALFSDWPVQKDVSVHFESTGRPPTLGTHGHAEVGAGTADFSGTVSLVGGVSVDMGVDARNVDLRSFDAAAPDAPVSASGRVALKSSGQGPVTGSFAAKTEPVRILGIDVPAATIVGKVDGSHVSGKGEVRDPALASDVDFDVRPGERGGPVVVDLAWSARVPELGRVAWLSPIGTGQARWRAQGRVSGGKLDARVDGDVERFARTGVRLEQAHVSGSVRGPFDRLALDASLDGTNLVAGPLYFPEVKAKAAGPLSSLRVTSTGSGPDVPELTARATVEGTRGGADIRDLELLVERGDVALAGKVKAIEIHGDRLDLREISLTGEGASLSASIGVSPEEVRVRASAADIDLKKLASVFAPGMPIAGHISLDVDGELGGKLERGHLRVNLTEGSLGGFSGLSAQAEVDATGSRFSGGTEVRFGELGSLSARTVDASIAGPLLRASSWTRASGRIEVDSQVDLDRLSKTPAALLVPSLEAGGQVFAKLLLAREALESHREHAPSASEPPPPDVDFLLWTDRLRANVRDASQLDTIHSPPQFSADGIDVQLGLHMEGEGQHAALTARLIDGQGIFAGLTALGDMPVEDLWRHPETAWDKLANLPITAKLTLPSRPIEKYPEMLRPSDWLGDVELTGSLTGSIRAPRVALAVRGHALRPASEGVAFPVDVDAQATYDGQKASARVRATRPEGVVLDARTEVQAPPEALFASAGVRAPWEASGSAKLTDFPLASVSSLAGTQVAGLASGTLQWNGLNRDPDIQAQLDFKDLKLDRASFPHAVANVRIAKGGVVASAKLEQESGGGSATASARVKWLSPWLPDIDSKEPLDVYFAAHDLRASALYPVLLRGIFTYFDGRLNGTLHYHQDTPKAEAAQTVDGSFDLRDGAFQIPEVGQEFRNAAATITMTNRGEVDVTNVSANGSSGRLTASGKMTMKGLSFVSGEGEVRIAKNEAVPLTLEGVSVGDAWGTLFLHAKRPDERTIKLDIDVPTFHTELPESSSRDVQGLDDHPDIHVGVRAPTGALTPLPLGAPVAHRSDDALVWRITFFLGQDVTLRRGRNLELTIGGEPVVDLTDEARVSGQIAMRGGNVEVFGKQFEIEHGLVKFEGAEPSNPYVNVTARWESPDGTRIFAEFLGPLRTGKLTLRSEPSRSQADVLAILLFGGSTDAVQQTQSQAKSSNTGEWVVGGAAVTTGVNKVLSSVTPLDITTRVSSDSQSPTPEVAIQLSPKLSAEFSYRTNRPTPFESQDRALVTLDWRFRRNWSVATTVGMQSTILDLIWRYRY